MAKIYFQGVPNGHWLVSYGYELSVFFNENSVAKNIEFENFDRPNYTLSVQYFSVAGHLDATELVKNWDFGNNDPRLVGFNELKGVRSANKVRMLPAYIPHGDLPEVQEAWKQLYELKKTLVRDSRRGLANALIHLRAEQGL